MLSNINFYLPTKLASYSRLVYIGNEIIITKCFIVSVLTLLKKIEL